MKTHELAKNLELLAIFLRQLPDQELGPEKSQIIQELLPGLEAGSKQHHSRSRGLREGVEARLLQMSPSEVEKFLSSEEEAFTTSNLFELAGRLGISSSKRQNKSALINLIVRHYEAHSMHNIIRSTRKEEP